MPGKRSLAVLALVAIFSAGAAAAANPGPRLDATMQEPNHSDLNQDGVVDWVQNQNQWQAATAGQLGAWVDANHDGLHDAWQNRAAWDTLTRGQYGTWVDANADGICDNFDLRPQDGTGQGFKGGN